MKVSHRYKFLILGVLLGLVQGALLLWLWPSGIKPCISCVPVPRTYEFEVYASVMLGFAFSIGVGMVALVGYVLDDYAEAMYSLFVSQPIVAAFILLTPLKLVFAAGLILLLLFFGLISGNTGTFLREWSYPARELRVASIPLFMGLVVQSLIVAISVWLLKLADPYISGQSLDEFLASLNAQFPQVVYLTLAIQVLVVLGLGGVVLGVIMKGYVSVKLAGPLMIASFVLGVLTIICIAPMNQLAHAGGWPNGTRAMLQAAVWFLYASIAIPSFVVLRLLFFRSPKGEEVTRKQTQTHAFIALRGI